MIIFLLLLVFLYSIISISVILGSPFQLLYLLLLVDCYYDLCLFLLLFFLLANLYNVIVVVLLSLYYG